MKSMLFILLLGLTLSTFPTASLACGAACGSCGAPDLVQSQPVRASTVVGDVVHSGLTLTAFAIRQSATFISDLPRQTRQQIIANSPQVQSRVKAVARNTETALDRISAEVTSLSLELLRSVLSSFWALISGLLLS